MKPLQLVLTIVLISLSLTPGMLGAPHRLGAVEVQDTLPAICELFHCTYGCPATLRAGLTECTPDAIAQDTYMVAQTQVMGDFCMLYACTPLACGPPSPGQCDHVEEQSKGHMNAGELQPLVKLLRWLKRKPKHNIGNDDQINQDSLQADLLEWLLSKRIESGDYASEG